MCEAQKTRRMKANEKKTILIIDCDDVCAKFRGSTVWKPWKIVVCSEEKNVLIKLHELDAYHSKGQKSNLVQKGYTRTLIELISHDLIVKFCISQIILSESILSIYVSFLSPNSITM